MSALDVACASDARYLAHSAAMLYSLVSSQGDEQVNVHFLHGPELDVHQLERLRSMLRGTSVSLEPHEIDPAAIAGLPEWGRIPSTMWYRILLPELLPEVQRILYLDIDVIVVDSLMALWDLNLDDFYLAAVTNVPARELLSHARELGLSGPDRYFNSGVLLMNLELMRRGNCTEALRKCALERLDDLLWPDQDALNIVLGDRRLSLHPRWNLMNSFRNYPWSGELLDPAAIKEAIRDPAIVHFEGPDENKPWHLLCTHPMRGVYFAHRRETAWPRVQLEGVTPANMARYGRRRLASLGRG